MPNILPTRVYSYTLAQLGDTDALKLSVVTNVAAQTYDVTNLDGALTPGPGIATMRAPQAVSITTSVSAGTYVLDDITFTGTNDVGDTITEVLNLTQVNGNETIIGATGFQTVTEVVVPAMNNAGGLIEIGVSGIVCNNRYLGLRIRAGAANNINMQFEDSISEVLPFALAETHDVLFLGVLDASTTADPIQVYLGLSPFHAH